MCIMYAPLQFLYMGLDTERHVFRHVGTSFWWGGGGGCRRAKIEKINKWNNIGVLSLSKNDQKKRGSHIKIDAFSISVYGAVCIPRQKAR